MKRVNLLPVYILSIAFGLCGCGAEVPELSQKEQAYVTEYATNLIVKYSSVTSRELLNDMQMERELAKAEEEKARYLKQKEFEKLYLEEENAKADKEIIEDHDEVDGQNIVADVPQKSIAEFFAEESIAIDYSSYSLCKSYPEDSEDDFFMAMDATPGHQLCVIKFAVTNISQADQEFNMLNKQGRFLLQMDDGEKIPAQTTLLVNDLSAYVGVIPTGETEELVLVFEVSDDISKVDSMNLIMRDSSEENVLVIQ